MFYSIALKLVDTYKIDFHYKSDDLILINRSDLNVDSSISESRGGCFLLISTESPL